MSRSKTVAICDPPYPGQAQRYYGSAEVEHGALIAQLRAYDGWALCTGPRMLQEVLALCPAGVRIAAWCKPNAAARVQWNPNYAWEPVIFVPVRKRQQPWMNDWIVAPTATHWRGERGPFRGRDSEPLSSWAGQKTPAFCHWVFELLGLEADDDLDDIFPGTGALSSAWETWRAARRCWPLRDSPTSAGEGAAS